MLPFLVCTICEFVQLHMKFDYFQQLSTNDKCIIPCTMFVQHRHWLATNHLCVQHEALHGHSLWILCELPT